MEQKIETGLTGGGGGFVEWSSEAASTRKNGREEVAQWLLETVVLSECVGWRQGLVCWVNTE